MDRLSKFKKKSGASEELTNEEQKQQYEEFMAYVSDCTDKVICQYLCGLNDYSFIDVFGDGVGQRIAGMSFTGSKHKYEIKFVLVRDEKKYSLVRPSDVDAKTFNKLMNDMDTFMRMDILFKKRFSEYMKYQNSRKNAPKVELLEGCKIFLRNDKTLYYIGNKHMTNEHIEFVEHMRALPISIGLEITKIE